MCRSCTKRTVTPLAPGHMIVTNISGWRRERRSVAKQGWAQAARRYRRAERSRRTCAEPRRRMQAQRQIEQGGSASVQRNATARNLRQAFWSTSEGVPCYDVRRRSNVSCDQDLFSMPLLMMPCCANYGSRTALAKRPPPILVKHCKTVSLLPLFLRSIKQLPII